LHNTQFSRNEIELFVRVEGHSSQAQDYSTVTVKRPGTNMLQHSWLTNGGYSHQAGVAAAAAPLSRWLIALVLFLRKRASLAQIWANEIGWPTGWPRLGQPFLCWPRSGPTKLEIFESYSVIYWDQCVAGWAAIAVKS